MKIDIPARFRKACILFQMEEYLGAYPFSGRDTPRLYGWKFLHTIYDDVLNFELYQDDFGYYHYIGYIRQPEIRHTYHY